MRTEQQALKDAINSGAVDAWINGEKTEIAANPHDPQSWIFFTRPESFLNPLLFHRVRPPEPTKINWIKLVEGKEPSGPVICLRKDDGGFGLYEFTEERGWHDPETKESQWPPSHWAPKFIDPDQ